MHCLKYVGIIAVLVCVSLPTLLFASVRINEIAWMGSHVSHNHQWIELYNTGNESVDLSGWRLISVGSTPQIDLTGSIDANGYYLLERTSDQSVPDIPADIIYTGALVNAGEHLQLIDAQGNIIDDINNSDGWVAGDNTTKETMQRTSTGWIAAAPTPRATNHNVPTQTSHVEQDSSSNTQSSDASLIISTQHDIVIEKTDTPDYTAHLEIPSKGISGVPVSFRTEVYRYGDLRLRGYYRITMGDGTEYTISPRNTADLTFEHTYAYPGSYVFTLEYRTNNFENSAPVLLAQQIITVTPSPLSITNITGSGGIEIYNDSAAVQDISGWRISNTAGSYSMPSHTYIAPHSSTVLMHKGIYSISTSSSATTLYTPTGRSVSTYDHPAIKHPSVQYYAQPVAGSHSHSDTVHTTSTLIYEGVSEGILSDRTIDMNSTEVSQSSSRIIVSEKPSREVSWGLIIGALAIALLGIGISVIAFRLRNKISINHAQEG